MTLEARMALFTPGQVTWPAIGSPSKCTDCAHYRPGKKLKNIPHGGCNLVKTMQRMKPKLFAGGDAIACSMFEELPTRPTS